MKRLYIILLSLSLSSVVLGQNKAEGDSAYVRGDYGQAISIYEDLLTKGESSEIYYNLGNSYYKVDEIGKAILNYERALLINPANTDARANLEIALSKTVDKLDSVPEIFFVAWISSLTNALSVRSWSYLGIIFFISFLALLLLYLFSRTTILKKVSFILSMIAFLLTILSNVFAYNQKSKLINRNSAIILSPSVTVKSTPSESGTTLFLLHEGSKVKIKDNSMKDWKEIILEDNKVGWIPSSSIEII